MGRVVRSGGLAAALLCVFASIASSQTASLTGYINDQTGAVVPNVAIVLTSETTGFTRQVRSDDDGLYSLVQLPPDTYTLLVERAGFQRVLRPNLALDAASTRRVDVVLAVGAVEDTVRVAAPARDLVADTTGQGTLIRPDEVQNLPVNGRSIQKLLFLAPGMVPVSAPMAPGEFSVNGQRASANYITVDGVSANVSTESTPSSGLTPWGNGTLPGFSPNGSSSSLFSLDAVETVRIQTSSFAPEFGRTPGAQISVVTKAGGSTFHGSAYEYFRDDALDATDFFVKAKGLSKPPMRFHTFGATGGGPLRLGPTFFFANYEGQRLTLPQIRTTGVPTLAVRDRTFGAVRTLLNAFPLPNGPELAPGVAEFSAAFSDTSDSNSGAFRADYAPEQWRVFGRVSLGRTESSSTGNIGSGALSDLLLTRGRTLAITSGANLVVTGRWFVESRVNYTENGFRSRPAFASINGAEPIPESLVLPSDVTLRTASVNLTTGITGNNVSIGTGAGASTQRQTNALVMASTVVGPHAIKVGTDIRYLAPDVEVPSLRLSYLLGSAATLQGSTVARVTALRAVPVESRFWNVSVFAQDQWQATERLALTYGIRWDINPPPATTGDRRPYLVEHPEDPTRSQRQSATEFWQTDMTGLAPRVAAVYRVSDDGRQSHVLRGALGLFNDIGWGGSTFALGRGFPFTNSTTLQNVALPLDFGRIPPLPDADASPGTSTVYSFPPDLSLPRSAQWNVGYEFALGTQWSAAATYLGSRGWNLTRTIRYDYSVLAGAPFRIIDAIDGEGRSRYHAVEWRLRTRSIRALDLEASYTLAHSRDNASDDLTFGIPSQREDPQAAWGPSSFDARHNLNVRGGFTTPRGSSARKPFGDVSVYLSLLYRSALPTTPGYLRDIGFGQYVLRPDVVPGVPLYLEAPSYPGGRRVNPDAFVVPTEARQGTAGRNSVRGFSLTQVDLSVKKRVRLARVQVDIGVDIFNLFNWPQFDQPEMAVSTAQFGLATQTRASGLGTGANGRGLSGLFQPGGPRSIQLALRTAF